jgi:transposase
MNKRRYKATKNREQEILFPPSIDEYVGSNNTVRAIDAYVDGLDIEALGFKTGKQIITSGQPAYDPAALLKLYLYGYLNQIHSSRKLERACIINLEVIWLMSDLKPNYKTVANFRSHNAKALRKANKDFVLLCKELDLFGKELVAVDGTFLKASANKSSIYTENNLKKQLKKIENKIQEYQDRINVQDKQDGESQHTSSTDDKDLSEKLEKLKIKQKEKLALQEELENSEDTQISTVDPDARLLRKRGQTTAGYNAQAVTDDKHNLIAEEKLTQDSTDSAQLYQRLNETKQVLGVEEITGLADSGYYDSKQLKKCEDNNITTYVPKQKRANNSGRIVRDNFIYNQSEDCYYCPQQKPLPKKGKMIIDNGKKMHQYRSSRLDCNNCPVRDKCLGKKSKTRSLYRWEHEEVLVRNQQRLKDNPTIMKKRGAMIEHPFGTIKYRAGMHHFLMRGLEKCQGEFSLMVMSYNFTRVLNIIGIKTFIKHCSNRAQYV